MAPITRLSYLTGRWAAEFQLTQQKISDGTTVLESRRGSSGHQNNPWFAISRLAPGSIHSQSRRRVRRSLVRSSRLVRLLAHQRRAQPGPRHPRHRRLQPLRLRLPAHPRRKPLHPRLLCRVFRPWNGRSLPHLPPLPDHANILPQKPTPKLRPVIYNSWEATEFAVDEPGQTVLAQKGRFYRSRTLHHGRRLVRPTLLRPPRPRRLVRQQDRSSPTASSHSSTRSTPSTWTSASGSSPRW